MSIKQNAVHIHTATGSARGIGVIVAAMSGLCFCYPALTKLAQYDKEAVGNGQLWRLLTGHFTHFGFEHLALNLCMFGVLLFAWPRRYERVLLPCILSSAILTSLGLRYFDPALLQYRGLSGIASALFVFVAIALLRDRMLPASLRLSGAALACAFCAKVAFEVTSGQAAFVAQQASAFEVAPLAHLIGGAIGAAFHLDLGLAASGTRVAQIESQAAPSASLSLPTPDRQPRAREARRYQRSGHC